MALGNAIRKAGDSRRPGPHKNNGIIARDAMKKPKVCYGKKPKINKLAPWETHILSLAAGSILRNLFNLHLRNQRIKMQFGDSFFKISDLKYKKDPRSKDCERELPTNVISENNKIKLQSWMEACERDPHEWMKTGRVRLSALDVTNENIIELLFIEIFIWSYNLTFKIPEDELFCEYTVALVYKAGEVVGRFNAMKDLTEEKSKRGVNRVASRVKNRLHSELEMKLIIDELNIMSLQEFRKDKKKRDRFCAECKKRTSLGSEGAIFTLARKTLKNNPRFRHEI